MKDKLRIATRQSRLALWQAHHVKALLHSVHPHLNIELVELVTRGDRFLSQPLSEVGGKGLFVKELERAMLDGRADIAVHSLKDMPSDLPQGLHLSTYIERGNPFDALIATSEAGLTDLPKGACVGTSSLRRCCQLKALRPDLHVKTLRGNVGTRIAKLERGEYDAIILAAAGLQRLGLGHRITHIFTADEMLPAMGQGIIAVESRIDDPCIHAWLKPLHHAITAHCARAERALNAYLGAGCHAPVAGYAYVQRGQMHLQGKVGAVDGSTVLFAEAVSSVSHCEALGQQVGAALCAQGARDLINGR